MRKIHQRMRYRLKKGAGAMGEKDKRLGPKLSDEYKRIDSDFKEHVAPLFVNKVIDCSKCDSDIMNEYPHHACVDCVDKLRAELAVVKAERDAAIQETEYIYCVYCGETFPLITVASDQVGEHIRTCSKHPMRRLVSKLSEVKAERDALKARVSELEWEVNLDGVALDACSSDSPAFLAMKAERDKLQRRIDSGAKVFVIIEKTINKYLEIDGTKIGSDAMYKQYLLMDRAYEQITALILRDDESEG